MVMDLNNAEPGKAFEGDYPELYGNPTQLSSDIVAFQRDELERNCSSSGGSDLILGLLKGRRSGRRDVTQFEVRSWADSHPSLLGRGEIVMHAKSDPNGAVANLLGSEGFTQVGGQQGDYVRWRNPKMVNDSVTPLLKECQALGVESWPNYVATVAAIGKGIGGPEPVSGPPGSFVDYKIPSAPEYGPEPGPRVAVIDTGIPSLDNHGGYPGMTRGDGWLSKVARDDSNRDLLDTFPNGPDGYLDFQAGHGTFVAGIVQRVAPGADIRVYRAADSEGLGTDDDIANALLRAVAEGARIVNLSLGLRTVDDQPPPALAAAVRSIKEQYGDEVVIVAAAGNYGDWAPCWPAALDGVEAVAGLTADLEATRWSSRGSHVRFSTVAEGIRSTFVTGKESPDFDKDPEVFAADAWALWTGTSFAAPQIAGAVARICHELTITPRQAVDKLHERAAPVATNGFGRAMLILGGLH
jgi:hypothetical protein